MALRRILHLDMDAFYASVEQRDDPSLRGKPVAVGGRVGERGVVAAASYEARAFGVRSAMSMSAALRNCPQLVVVRPDMSKYQRVSRTVFELFRAVTPLVEPLSMDEAYLDVTENAWHEPLGVTVARRLKQQVREATQLTISAGVAPNKFLAKIASGWKKPDGLTVIAPERMEDFLQKLPVDALWGVGPKTAARLRTAGIERLVDVRDAGRGRARPPSSAAWPAGCARSPTASTSAASSRTARPSRADPSAPTPRISTDLGTIQSEVAKMAEGAARWLEKRETLARTVTLKMRYKDFRTITRAHSERADARCRVDHRSRGAAGRQDRRRADAGPADWRQRQRPRRRRRAAARAARRAAAAVRRLAARKPPARPRARGDFAACVRRRLTATRSRRRMNALGRSIHVRGKGCAHDHDRFAHRDPSSSFSLVRTQARERGSACPGPSDPYAAFRLNLEQQRKRAKDLLRAVRAGDAAARRRLADAVARPAPDAVDGQARRCTIRDRP